MTGHVRGFPFCYVIMQRVKRKREVGGGDSFRERDMVVGSKLGARDGHVSLRPTRRDFLLDAPIVDEKGLCFGEL